METNNTTTSNGVHNAHAKDNAAKIVFGDPVLCAQFLKGYTDIPLFKEIKPEDIHYIIEKCRYHLRPPLCAVRA